MTQVVELTSDLTASLTDHMGTDLNVIKAARVSTQTEPKEGDEKLIDFLMRNKHASPFEACTAQFLVTAPIFVAREWFRHRTQSFSEVSGRYSILKPLMYAPIFDRPMSQIGKPGSYTFGPGTDDQVLNMYKELRKSYQASWDAYEQLLADGVAKELARLPLPVATYTSWFCTANLRNWLGFLCLRTASDAMFEIRELAFQVERQLFNMFPVTLEAWDRSGRGPL